MALEAVGCLRKLGCLRKFGKFIAYSSAPRLCRRSMMDPASFAALLASISAWLSVSLGLASDARPVVQRMVVRDEIVIHVPIARRYPALRWTERKGPKCLPANMIAGAAMASPSTIDFVMRDRRRIRARVGSAGHGRGARAVDRRREAQALLP